MSKEQVMAAGISRRRVTTGKRATLVGATVAALALGGIAPPASAKTFRGKAANAGKITFKTSGAKVTGFRLTTIALSCSDSAYDNTEASGPVAKIVVRNGKFRYDGYPQGEAGNRMIVSGKIVGRKASGTITVTNAHYDTTSSSTVFCTSGKRRWTARVR